MPDSKYSIEEIARRGDEIYDRSIRAEVEGKHDGQVVAIDVDTGDYALGEMGWLAAEPLLAQNPDAQIWLVRVGERRVPPVRILEETGQSMITGSVNARREAIIQLGVLGPDGQRQTVDAVIDTGFNGFLTLPEQAVAALGLRRSGAVRHPHSRITRRHESADAQTTLWISTAPANGNIQLLIAVDST